MNKEQFNELSIDEQFAYLNKLLASDETKTRSAVFKEIGIAKTTVGDRAKSHGYIFNTESNQYEYTEPTTRDFINRVLPNKPSEILDNPYPKNIREDIFELTNTQQKDLCFLLDNIDKIKSLMEDKPVKYECESYNLSTLVDDIYTFKKQPRDYKVKSLRIDISVLADFEVIALALSDRGIKQQELLSFIIHNFIESFNLNK